MQIPDSVEQGKWAAEAADKVSNAPLVSNDMHLFTAAAEKQMLSHNHRIIQNKSIYNISIK